MAFYNQDEDQQDPNKDGIVQTGPESSVVTGASGQGDAAGKTGASQPAGTPDKSGNFVGLQTYLDANKNQASKLGDQTAGVIQNSANTARDSVSSLNNDFNQSVDKNVVNEDKGALGLVGSTPENLSQDQKNQLKKQYSASYQGPSNLSDLSDEYTKAIGATNTANQDIQNAGTESGRGTLINRINSAPRTKGATSFDNILLQKGPGEDKVQAAAKQNADIKSLIDNSQQAAGQKAQAAKDTTAQAQADTYKSVQDALNSWQTGFAPKVDQARNNNLQTQNAVMDTVGSGNLQLDPVTQGMFGLQSGQVLFNNKLSDYVPQFNVSDINSANVATPEDYARYGALADLAGVQNPILNQADISKAGTAPQFSVNANKLHQDLAASQAAYDKARATPSIDTGTGAPPMSPDDLSGLLNSLKSQPMHSNQEVDQYNRLKAKLDEWMSAQGVNNTINPVAPTPIKNPVTTMPVRRPGYSTLPVRED